MRASIEVKPAGLAQHLADIARRLQVATSEQLKREESALDGIPRPVSNVYRDFQSSGLRCGFSDFSDGYAQTIAYGLLCARWMSRDTEIPFDVQHVGEHFLSAHAGRLFQRLVNLRSLKPLGGVIDELVEMLWSIPLDDVFSGDGRDPVIHFYEDFLAAYDPVIREEYGVFYTPDEVVQYIVRRTHTQLVDEFNLPLGLADSMCWRRFSEQHSMTVPTGVDPDSPFVQVLDPATGTGTFIKCTMEVVYETMMQQWADLSDDVRLENWRDYVVGRGAWDGVGLLGRISAFEPLMAPFFVAHFQIGMWLQQTGISLCETDRLGVYLTDTLVQSPAPSSDSAGTSKGVGQIKDERPISVIIGNPPYGRVSAAEGGHLWVLNGSVPGRDADHSLFDDILALARQYTIFSHHASLYNLYVYFWRWSIWRVFEAKPNRPGIVSLITSNSWLSGPGFLGLRQWVRTQGEHVQVVDLGGDNKAANPEVNVFNIETPVAIASVLRRPGGVADESCDSQYFKVNGETAKTKLHRLIELLGKSSSSSGWVVPPSGLREPLVPPKGGAQWKRMPLLSDVFPWQQPGCKFGRLWPIAPDDSVLTERWRRLLSSANDEERAQSFDTKSTGRTIHTAVGSLPKLAALKPSASHRPIRRYGYRSFDRQWAFEDPRLTALERPSLWASQSVRQLFMVAPMTKKTSTGPILTVSAYVPDMDFFRGSFGGKDVIPLYCDSRCEQPNITEGLLGYVGEQLGIPEPSVEDFAAYTYGLLGCHAYQARFAEALEDPGPRIPLTSCSARWAHAVALGRRLLWLQTYAERFCDEKTGMGGCVPNLPGIRWSHSVSTMPERVSSIHYDAMKMEIRVGDGRVCGVRPEVWSFSVSGMPVVKKWLGYRTAQGAGRAASSKNMLDRTRLTEWPVEWSEELIQLLNVLTATVDMEPDLDASLSDILSGPLIASLDLPQPTASERAGPASR